MIRLILFAAAVALVGAACGDNDSTEPTPVPTTPEATATATATPTERPTSTPTLSPTPRPTATPTPNPKPRMGVTTEAKGSRYTVNEMRDNLPGSTYSKPPAGKRWVAFDITQEGVTAGDPFNVGYFAVQDEEAYRWSSGYASGAPEPRLGSGNLQTGEMVRGWVVFEVAADAVLVSVLAQPEPLGGMIVIADLTQP